MKVYKCGYVFYPNEQIARLKTTEKIQSKRNYTINNSILQPFNINEIKEKIETKNNKTKHIFYYSYSWGTKDNIYTTVESSSYTVVEVEGK